MSRRSSDVSSGLPSPPRTPPRKPHSPYVVGATFIAKSHIPPAPFGKYYGEHESCDLEQLPSSAQLEWCIAHPPAPGVTKHEDTICIGIANTIRIGSDCGAQIVLLESNRVAEIFDLLYYEFYDTDGPAGLKIDVTAKADSDYVIEAAAYNKLQHSTVPDGIIPDYYGSWTIDVETLIGNNLMTREVRIILMEFVPGVRMLDLDPEELLKEERENIMRKMIEADYTLRYAGVQHDDISPRNIIISRTTAFSSPDLRLTLVDFGCSTVYDILYGGSALPEYNNPLFHWTSADLWSSRGWLSADEERVEWMWRVWADGCEGKYVQVERDPDNIFGAPKEPELGELDGCVEVKESA
ncbi:hypothetical protein FB567DRAFT_178449 [Paraphoma chrysanthemicola]|uniref:Protein kinase domain-containing protein n=1 Tax=Paraphoma chrysanthemicola TaxID=798071 RepID=A0A8K0RGL5_9PLEO|nr:hypothetical protein FB567DRAFT_178449 [Paraphoma chrysanthemicola]